MVHLYSSKLRPRQSNANMFCLKVVNLRADLDHQTEESIVNVSLLPLRINVDQDTLFFVIDFFSRVFPSTTSTSYHQPHIRAEAPPPTPAAVEIQPAEEVTEEFKPSPPQPPPPSRQDNKDIYIRSFIFTRDVAIRIDYSAKYVDLTQGAVAGLLAGLTSLNCSELTLKRIRYRNGILGVDRLLSLLVTEWLADIRQNQVRQLFPE